MLEKYTYEGKTIEAALEKCYEELNVTEEDIYTSSEEIDGGFLKGKKVVTFAVGLNIMQKETRMQLREINFDKSYVERMTCYYCPGAYKPEEIKGIDAGIMKLMVKMLEGKGASELTEDDKKLLDAVKNGANYLDRKYIEPIVNEFK